MLKPKIYMALITFRTKGISPNTWQVKQTAIYSEDENGVLREINYFKGRESIYVDDPKNAGVKPSLVPIFEYNEVRNQCELTFNDVDRNLVAFLKAHGHFNKRFEVFSEEAEAQKKLNRFEKIDLATKEVVSRNGNELKALGVVIFGLGVSTYTEEKLRLELRELAFNEPSKILDYTLRKNFDNIYVGSLAFVSNIVKTNITQTSVMWTDNDNEIISVAKGENPIEKFGEFLNSDKEEAKVTLQSIGERLKKVNNTEDDKSEIETLQSEYFVKFGKSVPPAQKNNVEWIKSKLKE